MKITSLFKEDFALNSFRLGIERCMPFSVFVNMAVRAAKKYKHSVCKSGLQYLRGMKKWLENYFVLLNRDSKKPTEVSEVIGKNIFVSERA